MSLKSILREYYKETELEAMSMAQFPHRHVLDIYRWHAKELRLQAIRYAEEDGYDLEAWTDKQLGWDVNAPSFNSQEEYDGYRIAIASVVLQRASRELLQEIS